MTTSRSRQFLLTLLAVGTIVLLQLREFDTRAWLHPEFLGQIQRLSLPHEPGQRGQFQRLSLPHEPGQRETVIDAQNFSGDAISVNDSLRLYQSPGGSRMEGPGRLDGLSSALPKENSTVHNVNVSDSISTSNAPTSAPLSNSTGSENIPIPQSEPSCHQADPGRLSIYLASNYTLPKPVINLGMPKVGSTTLLEFFKCSGWKASHWQTSRHGLLGGCFQKAVDNGKPLLDSCDSWYHPTMYKGKRPPSGDSGAEAFLQMDYALPNGTCRFPQAQDLDRIHKEAPNATFILMFRPVEDWFRSLRDWPPIPVRRAAKMNSILERLTLCDLPGLPAGKGNSLEELQAFWCGHVRNVRSFVEKYPSHKLVELNLYETERNSKVMPNLFHSRPSCWGHANANKKSHR